METLIRRWVLWRLVWVCTVCLCPTKRMLGLYGLNLEPEVLKCIQHILDMFYGKPDWSWALVDISGLFHSESYRPWALMNISDKPYWEWEPSGSVVECLTWDQGAADSSFIDVTALCSLARHINPSLLLVQPRKTDPYITERLLMERKE